MVWERGSGLTLACGTGACATVVAACLEERLAPGVETPVHLPGGTLAITVAKDYSSVRMRGPAHMVFEASIDVRAELRAPAIRCEAAQNSVPWGRVEAAGGGRPRCS